MADDSGGDEPQLRSAMAARRRLLLMLGVAELQHGWQRLSPVWHWVTGLALTMAASTLIEESKLFDSFEDAVVREVARQRSLKDELRVPAPHELQIQQLEISATSRVTELEQRSGIEAVVQRLGGVAPIDRGKMAEAIDALAKRLPVPGPTAAVPIVAIDVDLAPLEAGATTLPQRQAMLEAIEGLRQRAHVIAVTLPREAGPDGSRDDRNCFMRATSCTRLAGASAEPPPDHGRCDPLPRRADEPKLHALFFASPRLFQPTGSYPTKYPYKLKTSGDKEFRERMALPPFFPSLGTLIQLQHRHGFSHALLPLGSASDKQDRTLTEARQSLTALCEQAHSAPRDGALLEDRMATPDAEPIARSYDEQRYSWRLLDDPRLQHTTVDSIASIRDAQALGDAALARPVVLLGVDGGASYDKFGIAGLSAQTVSGAGLHALQALSIEWQPSALKQKFAGILVDVGLGIVYSLLWLAFYGPLLKPLRSRMPVIGGWLIAGVPLGLGVGLAWMCFKLVAIGMEIDLWINPIYIVVGLLLGIYVDAWSDSQPGTEEERKVRSRLLGLPAAREALRSGFGHRVEGVQFAATSSYQTVTGMDELRVQAEVVRSRLGAAALTDAVLSAVLRLVVLLAGWTLILLQVIEVWRS